jgi:hypothetical protein
VGKGLLVADSDGTVGLSRRLNPRLGEDGSSLVLGEGRVDDKEPKTEDGLGEKMGRQGQAISDEASNGKRR